MKVLYLVYGPQSGVVEYLRRSLSEIGIKADIFNAAENLRYRMKRFRLPSLLPHNILAMVYAFLQYGKHWMEAFIFTDYALEFMSNTAQSYAEEHRDEYDIILQSGTLFSVSAKKLGKPYCIYIDHTHMISEKYQPIKGLDKPVNASEKWLAGERSAYEQADIVFTLSDYVKKSLITDYSIPHNKIEVTLAGPILKEIPDIADKVYDGKTILFVGKEFSRKGGYVLLEAFKLVREVLPEAKLVVVGTNISIKDAGVINAGLVKSEAMPEFYKKASLFVMPTLREPFGLAYLEAMAYGLPCVGTNIEAVPEIIEDGITGFIVSPLDPAVLAEKLIVLLGDQHLMRKMGRAGHDNIIDKFNWGRVADLMVKRLKSLIKPVN